MTKKTALITGITGQDGAKGVATIPADHYGPGDPTTCQAEHSGLSC